MLKYQFPLFTYFCTHFSKIFVTNFLSKNGIVYQLQDAKANLGGGIDVYNDMPADSEAAMPADPEAAMPEDFEADMPADSEADSNMAERELGDYTY